MSRNKTLMVLGIAAGLASTVVLPTRVEARAQDDGPTQSVVVQVADGEDPAAVAADADAEPAGEEPVGSEPVMSLRVTSSGLDELEQDPRVEAVLTRGTTVEPALAQSVVKVGAPGRHSAGFDGDGKVIAVIDTGVAPTFGGTLVGQACFAATQVGAALVGHCGTGSNQEQAFDQACFTAGVCSAQPLDAQAARPCPGSAQSCQHGTAVAAVAARHDAPVGVAPDAGVYAIRVFNPAGSTADLLDIYLALEHVVDMSDAGAFDIAAVNLSVATAQTFAGDCRTSLGAEGPLYDHVFGELRARGIAPVVASGNNGDTTQIAFPACVPAAISVGSTDLDDDLASFGNRGAGLDLLAPGADEASLGVAVDPMEIPGNTVGTWSGTSFSAPHVAGAFTLMAQEYPNASVAQSTWFLQAAGVPVAEGGRTYRRLLLRPAPEVLLGQVLFPGEAPVGAPRVALGDVDGDGRTDVVAHAPGPGADRISYGGSTWSFVTVPVHRQRQLHAGGRQPQGRGHGSRRHRLVLARLGRRPPLDRRPRPRHGVRPGLAAGDLGARRRRLRRRRVGRRPLVRPRRRAGPAVVRRPERPDRGRRERARPVLRGRGRLRRGRPRRPAARRPRYGYRRALARGGPGDVPAHRDRDARGRPAGRRRPRRRCG